MFDLHNHCLPGLDDGARNWEESLAMARMAVEDGIEGVVCTPHWARGSFENNRDGTLMAVAAFKAKLEAHKIPLKVYPGAEIRLDFDVSAAIASGEVLTVNDNERFVLIELLPEILPRNLENLFWDLQVQRIRTIISHPERNPALLRNPGRLHKWVEMGILTQVTAASLFGSFGEEVRQFAVMLLEHRMVHIIATDSHGLGVRSPRLSTGYEEAARIVGHEAASQMVGETPRRIIEGETVFAPDPLPLAIGTSRPSFWKRSLSFFRTRRVDHGRRQ
jgi:protein-tyrosine phosphatase